MKKEDLEEAQKIYKKITSIECLINCIKSNWTINIECSSNYNSLSTTNNYSLNELNISNIDILEILENKKEKLEIQFENI